MMAKSPMLPFLRHERGTNTEIGNGCIPVVSDLCCVLMKEPVSSLFSSASGAFSTAFRVSFNILVAFFAFFAKAGLAARRVFAASLFTLSLYF